MRKFLFVLFLCLGVILTSCTEDESSPVGDVYGIVSDTKSGAPIRNAEVVISPSNASTVSGSDGHFEFKSLTPGQYKISVTADGYASNSRQVTIAAGQRISCDIHLTPEASNDAISINPTSIDFGTNELQLAATITNESDSETEWFLDLGDTPWLYAYPTTGRIGGGKTHSIVFTANRARMKEDKSSVVNISAFGDTHPLSLKCKQSVQLSSVMVVESLNVDFGEEATEQIIRIRNISETDVNWTLWGNDSGYLTMSATHGIVTPGSSQIVTISLNREELNEVLATTFKISDGTVDQPVNVIAYPTPEGVTTTNKIFYTSIDGNIVEPNDPSAFLDANGNVLNIISNTYEYGQGIIVFDGEVDRTYIQAFSQCQTLVSITLPSKLTYMGNFMFSGCSNLVSINIPDGVTSTGVYAFDGCSGLTSIDLPNGITSIENGTFYHCSSLTSIDIPDGVTSIGENAFSQCGLTSINIPDGVTSIGSSAFSSCSGLPSITIPDGVTSIGNAVFWGCESLTSITIGNGVTSIGEDAFRDCSSLTSVNLGSGVTSIGEDAFRDCSSLTSVNLGSGVTSIGPMAFYGCISLTSIGIPDGVTSIGGSAFVDCSGLTSITIPNGVTSIGNSAFNGCSGLTSITIPDGVTSIGTGTFEYCSSLTSVNLGSGVTSIGERAFNGCSGLTSINIPDGVTSIERSAFSECTSLTSIDLPNGITSIENGTFWCCFSLTSVNLGSGVTSIGNDAFFQCGLTSINIPDGVTSIGNSAFHQCDLTSIAIPENVTLIGEGAFSNCNWLTSVYCRPTTPPTLGADVFNSNASDRKIYVSTSSADAYKAAENWSSYADAIVGYDF